MRGRWGDGNVLLNHGRTEWKQPQLLYAVDALLAESEEGLDGMVGHFSDVLIEINVDKIEHCWIC